MRWIDRESGEGRGDAYIFVQCDLHAAAPGRECREGRQLCCDTRLNTYRTWKALRDLADAR